MSPAYNRRGQAPVETGNGLQNMGQGRMLVDRKTLRAEAIAVAVSTVSAAAVMMLPIAAAVFIAVRFAA